MQGIYITFDNYYDVDNYNSFKTAAKNNGIEFEEYIRIKQPFNRFIKLESSKDLPSFLDYDIASSTDMKWLVSVIKPVNPNEEYLLRRREANDLRYWDYILPKPMKKAHKKDYFIAFKAMDMSEVQEISKKLGNIKIYKWGKSEIKRYNIYYCYNPNIKNYVFIDNVLLEYGKEASWGLRNSKNVPSVPGKIEQELNYYVLIKEKLENKTLESEYWINGKFKPLARTTFI